MFVAVYQLFTGPARGGDEKIAFGQFMQEVQTRPENVKKVLIKGNQWTGEFADGRKFRTTGPSAMSADHYMVSSTMVCVINFTSDSRPT